MYLGKAFFFFHPPPVSDYKDRELQAGRSSPVVSRWRILWTLNEKLQLHDVLLAFSHVTMRQPRSPVPGEPSRGKRLAGDEGAETAAAVSLEEALPPSAQGTAAQNSGGSVASPLTARSRCAVQLLFLGIAGERSRRWSRHAQLALLPGRRSGLPRINGAS